MSNLLYINKTYRWDKHSSLKLHSSPLLVHPKGQIGMQVNKCKYENGLTISGHVCVMCGNKPSQCPSDSFLQFPSNAARKLTWLWKFEVDMNQLRSHSSVCQRLFLMVTKTTWGRDACIRFTYIRTSGIPLNLPTCNNIVLTHYFLTGHSYEQCQTHKPRQWIRPYSVAAQIINNMDNTSSCHHTFLAGYTYSHAIRQ